MNFKTNILILLTLFFTIFGFSAENQVNLSINDSRNRPTPLTLLDPDEESYIIWDETINSLRYEPRKQLNTSKQLTIEQPTTEDDISMFYTSEGIILEQLTVVVRGDSPSVVVNIKHSLDRDSVGTPIISNPNTISNETLGDINTSFNDGNIPPNSYVWLEFDNVTGTVDECFISLEYTGDTFNVFNKNLTIEQPTIDDDITLFRTTDDITLTKLVGVVRGDNVSISTNIFYAPNRDLVGTKILNTDVVINSETIGNSISAFDQTIIPANSFIWIENTDVSGSVEEFFITLEYTK